MTLSTIYIIIEAGVSGFGSTWLHNLAVAIMISAPEIILPGGFILASEIRAQGNRRWWMLSGMCWAFVILTGVTLADLFIWHLKGDAFAALMWGRCAAAVGYSILFRVITYRRETEVMAAPDVLALVEQKGEEMVDMMTQRITETERRLTDQVRQFQAENEQRMQAESDQTIRAISTQLQADIAQRFSALSEQLSVLTSSHKSEDISLTSEAPSRPESSETKEQEAPQEADGTSMQGRKYFVTFEEASALTGLSILQLKRRVSAGEIDVGSGGKVRVKSLQNLSHKPRKVPTHRPALSLVSSSQSEAVNE